MVSRKGDGWRCVGFCDVIRSIPGDMIRFLKSGEEAHSWVVFGADF